MKILSMWLMLLMSVLLTACVNKTAINTEQFWNDNNIEFEVAALSNKKPFTRSTRIEATSYKGVVILMGQASTEALLKDFEQKVKATKGVRRIHNQVRIREPLSAAEVTTDGWITTKIKSALLAESKLKSIKIKVITEDREVFLIGNTSQEQAAIATDIAKNIDGVRQVIRAFQYLDE